MTTPSRRATSQRAALVAVAEKYGFADLDHEIDLFGIRSDCQ